MSLINFVAKVILKFELIKLELIATYIKSSFNLPKSTKIINGRLKIIGDFKCQEHCKFNGDITIKAMSPIRIGRYTSISGPNTDLVSAINPIKIGSFCSIARNVTIQEYNHNIDNFSTYYFEKNIDVNSNFQEKISKGPIEIGDDVWISTQCVILSGAKIGTGAVIGANSVVVGEIPAYAIAAGNPAKVIKYRFSEDKIQRLLASKWPEKLKQANFQDFQKQFS